MKLLIVDDEKIMKEYIKFVISQEKLDIEVFEASNGEEAIEMATKIKPQGIFMDIKMPRVDGLKGAEIIRKELPQAKIIFLSAYDNFDYVQKALRLGAYDYLLKPIAPKDLKEMLKNLMDLGKEEEKSQEKIVDPSYEDDVILKAKAYIQEHYKNKIHLQDVADEVNLSSAYFSKYFKKKTEMNFSHYLNKLRLSKAKELMKNPNLTLNEIALEVGYEDLSYFSIVFQRYEDTTPTSYRRQIMTK
ncbi:response regulator transcription factor [Natronincola ferrireducens]|uniref:Stage 0 sporulation protein A homolog n=1 Tax=Natronincola ferrireducens TaxID=393762 RepID=A0A1G8XRE6_9FIRM|nr:response regulator [Natronincola ferrireducens]SDJ92340.1 two component transcriptional regulator, AraC family [Natronincola ferrireducens]